MTTKTATSSDDSADGGSKLLRVGELARVSGKTVRAMHLYEELGLVKPASRSAGGYRLYAQDAVTRVSWITRLQEMGFSLPEIQVFLHDWEGAATGAEAMSRVRAVFHDKLRETRESLRKMHVLERDLVMSLAYLEGCVGCEPSRQQGDCACCGHHGHVPAKAPPLVAGLARADHVDVPLGQITGTLSRLTGGAR